MKPTLLKKFILCYLVILISSLAVLNTYGAKQIKRNLIQNKIKVLNNEAELIFSEYRESYYQGTMTLPNLTAQLKTVDTYVDARIWIVSKEGIILSDTRPIHVDLQFNLNEWNPDFLKQDSSSYVYLPGLVPYPMISVVLPVTIDFELKGYIVLLSSLKSIEKESIYFLDTLNICFLLIGLIFLLAMVYLYFISITPLRRIIVAAKEYAKGNLDYPLKIKTHDEFKDLADTVGYMAGELTSMDKYQKKFIANVSHDFRSPLTSIKGYAEAMMDGTIPPELYEKYLGTILFETERLTKLTSGLLELHNFDHNKSMLEISSFDINPIIKRTAESFEGTCRNKRITLRLIFSDQNAFVDADMGKIQQVLYNLIDNAIKFSQKDSEIQVSTYEKGAKIFISVKDFGIGIPKESQKKIWDRFYKIDSSRGKDKKGTGLGLSIVKEIITAHSENINVISTEEVGTEFIFTLPKTEDL